jgi:hypothetical protein
MGLPETKRLELERRIEALRCDLAGLWARLEAIGNEIARDAQDFARRGDER